MIKTGVFFCCFLVAGTVVAHGGRTNSEGCHRESSTNTRHCHGDGGAKTAGLTPQKVAVVVSSPEYDRDEFMTRWIDADGDCQDARQEVLIAESLVNVTLTSDGCQVISGLWYDPYTDSTFNDPSDLDIDHFVPLEEAYESGASWWSGARKNAYANDLEHPNTLIAVSLSANRSKGSRDPSEWMPPNAEYHCDYLKTWIEVKEHFQFSMDPKEITFITNKIREC